ncbi:hypothetical protein ACERZ8_00180 [Tateyamaria armeniaca]|uniref:PilJ/NarX-like methyl-accepting chemotaxis transducer n=1 Tax=Tateyamaria armeniaca TaxID=2518930 RepID=A0ABW8UMK7_9RHOB
MTWRLLCAVTALVAGCGTTAGVREFQTYTAAFNSVYEASDAILTEISAAERAAEIDLIDGPAAQGVSSDFDPANIAIFAPDADPPFVAATRFAINSVLQFNDILSRYAAGRALIVLRDESQSIRDAGLGFADPNAENLGSDFADISKSVRVIRELFSVLEGAGSREAFRTEMRRSGTELVKLLDLLVSKSDIAFDLLTQDDFADLDFASGAQAAEIRNRIKTEREMLASWLYMIQQSRGLLQQTMNAIDAPQSASSRLVETAVIAGDLRARAEMIKRTAIEN